MQENHNYIIPQNDSLPKKNPDISDTIKKKKTKAVSALHASKDSSQKKFDSIVVKKDSAGIKIRKKNADTTLVQVTDTIQSQNSDSLSVGQNPTINKEQLYLVPVKARYFFTDLPKYNAIDLTSLTTQKYSNINEKNFYLPEKNYNRNTTDWVVIAGIISLIVLGWVYGFFKKYLAQLFQSTLDDKISFKLMEERSSITERISFALNVLFVLNTGLFLYEIMSLFKISLFDLHGFSLFILMSVIIIIIYLTKYIIYYIMGMVLHANWQFSEIIHSIFLYNKIFGIFLIPIIIFIPYIEEYQARFAAYLGFAFFAISLLF